MKKKLIPLDKTLPLYIVIILFVGYMSCKRTTLLLPFVSNGGFWIFYSLCTLALPVAYLLSQTALRATLDKFGSYWMCFQFTTSIAAALDLLISLALGLLRISTVYYPYIASLFYLATYALSLYGIIHAKHVYITRYTCNIKKRCGKLHIVHLSDFHLSSVNNKRVIEKIVQRVNKLEPDLICITGDTFTEMVSSIPDLDGIAQAMSGFKSRYGTFACLGNHDYGKDFPYMLDFFENANIRLLMDESIAFDDFILIGRLDIAPGGRKPSRKPIAELVPANAGDKAIIMMDHQPAELWQASECGVDCTLSGHTHGGQFFPIQLAVRRFFQHYKGLKMYGKMYAIISSGSDASVPPIRIGSRSEIISISIQ